MEVIDDEKFCGVCFAGVESDEHHARCVKPLEDALDERAHWEAEHAALWSAVARLAETKPGATGRALRTILGAPTEPEADVYVIEGPRGWTASFNEEQVDLLERCGLIRHDRDGHVLESNGRGVGPLHRYYREAIS
jgi:hypothetical protein